MYKKQNLDFDSSAGISKTSIEKIIDDNNEITELKKKISTLEKEISNLMETYPIRRPIYDDKVPFHCSLEEFKKLDVIGRPAVYIIVDENGRYYIGQTDRDDYKRIMEHFEGTNEPLKKSL